MKIKLWIIPAFSLLCFGLTAQSLALDPRQSKPSALLQTNNTPALSESQIETDSASCTVDCIHSQTSDAKTISEIQNIITKTAEKSCELLSSQQKLKDGKLTDYWAQEIIGADLLREEIEKAPPLLEDKFLTAVFDTYRVEHNIQVQNVISHKKDQAVLPELNSEQIQFFETDSASQYITAVENIMRDVNPQNRSMNDSTQLEVEKLLPQKKIPSFINNSMSWGWKNSSTIYKAMSRIIPPAVLVQSSGNSYPDPLDSTESQFSKNFDSILVGSLSPNGVVSSFSQEGEEVHILAPSGDWLTSVDSEGKYKKFGGTSGAAPLVTGSLAGFEWLSGYHPTAKEVKFLLEQTAIPTIHSAFEEPQKNGVGMLNAYKLGMTAKRLKEKCHTDPDCFQREIKNKANYEFSIDEEDILEQTNNAFPECSDQKEVQAISCEDKKTAFKKLRQAVLLDIENVSLLKKLQCIYTQEGFSENAVNTGVTVIAVTRDKDQVLKTWRVLAQNSDVKIQKEAARVIAGIGGREGLEILKGLAKDSEEWVREAVAQAMGRKGGKEGLEVLKGLVQDSSKKVRRATAYSAGQIGGKEGLEILKDLFQDSSEEVRRAVAYSAGQIGATKGLEILKDLVQDSEAKVRVETVRAVGKIGSREGLEMLKVLAKDSDVWVRKEVASVAGSIGGREGLEILKGLAKDSDVLVREEVASVAGSIGGREGLEILKGLAKDSDILVRREAASVAGSIGGREGLEMLKGLVQDSSKEVRQEVAMAVGRIGSREGLEILKGLAKDSDAMVRQRAAYSAGVMGDREGLEVLKVLAKDSEAKVRGAVASAVGSIGGRGGLEMLKILAKDSDARVRGATAGAVGSIGGRGGLEMLKVLSKDSDIWVRRAAARGAGRIGGKEGLEILKDLAKDSNARVRRAVVYSAGKMGGREGLEILKGLAKDSDARVRKVAIVEIKQLQ